MSMVFCRGCGKEIHETAVTCPHCGAPQSVKSTTTDTIPDGIKGWSWGAFLLSGFWAIGNKTWVGLLAFIPYVGFIMSFILGFKGREWAWKNKQWDSVEHFNRVQKKWSYWGVMIIVVSLVIGILAAVAIPAYQSYQHRAQEEIAAKNSAATPWPQQTVSTPQPALQAQATSILGMWDGLLEGGNGKMEIKPDSQHRSGMFNISIGVSGQTGCAGSFSDTGYLDEETGMPNGEMYLKLTEVLPGGEMCVIDITFAGNTADISEYKCFPYHGVACGFSGKLKKIQ